MNVRHSTVVPGVVLFVRTPHTDERGSFQRVFAVEEYERAGVTDQFVEDNVSVSKRGVLRGLHCDPRLAKFVQVPFGKIFDVVVDAREGSQTFGSWESFVLTGIGGEQLYVPRGCAHGFYVLSETAVVSYKQTAPYDPSFERQLLWSDPSLAIAWPVAGTTPLLSAKDAAAPTLAKLANATA